MHCQNINVIEDWVFYTDEIGAICRIRTDGEMQEVLFSGGACTNLNFLDNWIYYCNYTLKQVYKIRTNGEDNQQITAIYDCENICMQDGWIYYSKFGDNIHKYNIDSGIIETITKDNIGRCVLRFGVLTILSRTWR